MDKNMVPVKSENRLGKLSMGPNTHIKAESGTCNVCSAPCSSCMHLKLNHTGSKGDEYSDENCHESATSQYYINEGDAAPSKTRARDSLRQVTSEASNPLSVSSSHDSLSEIADSKADIRSSSVDASLESGILKLSSVGVTTAYKTTSNIKHEDCKTEEGHDDNISCVSRANDVSVSVSCPNKNLEKKNILHSSPLANRLGMEGSGKDNNTCQKSELTDTTSDADGGGNSPMIQTKCLTSNENAKHLEEDSSFDNHGKSVEVHMILPLPKEAAPDIVRHNNFSADAGAVACRHNESSVNVYNLKTSCMDDTKLESEGTRGSNDQKNALKCSHLLEQDEKSNGSLVLANLQDPLSQSLTGNESEDSENLEQDVKVCDICGDAGREDLLAICNKCSDGAEHTYCMREMLQEVPKGYWLCEECKSADENENKKQGLDIEGEKTNKVSTQNSFKRQAENMKVSSDTKRQAIDMSAGLRKPASPGRMPSLSRDSSFKNLDKAKVKHAHASPSGSHSGIDISGVAHSSFTGQRLQVLKGTLSKSSSFSTLISKAKVKLVDEVPQIHSSPRESSSDTKEASGRMMSKSLSFKSVNSGRSAGVESKVKMLPSNFSHVHDIKRLKQVKEGCAFERKKLPKLDRSISSKTFVPKVGQAIAPYGESGMASPAGNNRELKTLRSNGKLGILSRSNSCVARRGFEIPVSSVPASSTDGMGNAFVEQRLNQVNSKEELSSCSWAAERLSNSGNENLQDGSPQSWESSNQDERATDSSVTRLRTSVNAGSKSMASHPCKEIGHPAELCTMGSCLASGSDALTARSVREEMNKGSKLKAAIETAMIKKPAMCRKKKENDQPDVLSSSNVDANCEIASQEKFSGLSKISEIKHDSPATSQSLSSEQTNINNLKQHNVISADGVPSPKGDSDSLFPSGNPSFSSASTLLYTKMLPVPEHEYIWQGAFEVRRAGKFSYLYSGVQAHLSTCASPKVLEVVNKFTQKITLDEVTRSSTWPRQFHDCGVREDNIALYFFAKDIESYTKTYKGLLQNMIQKDLALKGSFDGVELFIFPSTQLPEDAQRWNLLFFMWGVFKGRRSNWSESLKKSVDKEIPKAVMSSCEKLRLAEKEATGCIRSSDVPRGLNAHCNTYISSSMISNNTLFASKMDQQTQASGFDTKPLSKIATDSLPVHPEIRCSSPSMGGVNLPDCKGDVKLENFTPETGCIGGPNASKEGQTRGHALCLEETSSIKSFQNGKKDLGFSRDFEESVVAKTYNSDEVKVERDLNKGDMSMDIEVSFEPRKRPYLDLSEVAPQTSGCTSETTQKSNIEGSLIEGGNMCKKLKTGPGGLFVLDVVRDGNSSNDSFALQKFDFGSSSSVVEETRDKAPYEKIILEDLGSTERYFFPVDSYLGSKSVSSLKEKSYYDATQIPEVIPNLELALGGERKSHNKGAASFFVGMMGTDTKQNTNREKLRGNVMDEEEEDGVSASLSLSLSLPSFTRNKL